MDHLPFILGAYGLFVLVAGWLSLDAVLRMRRAKRRLAAVDTRRR